MQGTVKVEKGCIDSSNSVCYLKDQQTHTFLLPSRLYCRSQNCTESAKRLADYHRRSGIKPCPEELVCLFSHDINGNASVFLNVYIFCSVLLKILSDKSSANKHHEPLLRALSPSLPFHRRPMRAYCETDISNALVELAASWLRLKANARYLVLWSGRL